MTTRIWYLSQPDGLVIRPRQNVPPGQDKPGKGGGGPGKGGPGRGGPGQGGPGQGGGGGGVILLPTFIAAGTSSVTGFSGTPAPGYPAGIENGDLLIYVQSKNSTSTTAPNPTDWPALVSAQTGLNAIEIFYRFHDGTTPSTATVGSSTSTTSRIFAFRGANAVDPFGTPAGANGTGTTGVTLTGTGLASDTSDALLFFAGTYNIASAGTIVLGGANVDPESPDALWVASTASGGDRTSLAKAGRANATGALEATFSYGGTGSTPLSVVCVPINPE